MMNLVGVSKYTDFASETTHTIWECVCAILILNSNVILRSSNLSELTPYWISNLELIHLGSEVSI